ncbi:MAG: c(7)-type cytochrome triheme domain-containing protein [Nitrospiria bacterium]
MKNINKRSKIFLIVGTLFILTSCSWLHTAQQPETKKEASTSPGTPSAPAPEPSAPAASPVAPPVATPEPPPSSPAPLAAAPETKTDTTTSAAVSSEMKEVDYSHITLAPGPDERPLTREEISKIPPSEAIYLSGRGVMAGKGDPNHPPGDANRFGRAKHPLALEVSDLPKDQYGLINWADALRQGKVIPKGSLNPDEPEMPPFDLSFDIPTKSNFMPNVIFPHKIHTMWLTCTNCHPAIFLMNHVENNKNMTMPKIASGEFCGRCHNRVAFPLSDCLRCHVVPKEGDKFEGSVFPGAGDVSMELCGNQQKGCPAALSPPATQTPSK